MKGPLKAFMASPVLTALMALLFFGFVLRINAFDISATSIFNVDVARDYLLAGHMVQYGDVPITGPDGYFGSQSNSPLYFYFIAVLLWIHDSILFPGLINVFLQTASIFLVFILGKNLFGNRTGLLAAGFFTVFDATVAQAVQMWQPYAMSFFLLLSWCFLCDGYKRMRTKPLYVSASLFVLAAILHNSVFAIAPVYGALLLWILYRQHAPKKVYVGLLSSSAALAVCAYLPTLYYFMSIAPLRVVPTAQELLYLPPPLQNPNIYTVILNTIERTIQFTSYFFAGAFPNALVYGCICLSTMGIGLWLYISHQKNREKKFTMVILLSMVVLVIGAVGSLKLYPTSDFPVRYYTPIFVPLLIALAEFVVFFTKKTSHFLVSLSIFLVTVMVVLASWNTVTSLPSLPHTIRTLAVQGIAYPYMHDVGIQKVVTYIQTHSPEQDPLLAFDIRTFEHTSEQLYKSELVWISLEHTFGQQLVHPDSSTFRGYAPLHTPHVMFIQCIDLEVAYCTTLFNNKYSPQYQIDGVLFESDDIDYLYAHKI